MPTVATISIRYLGLLGIAIVAWLAVAFSGLFTWLKPTSEAQWVAALYQHKEAIAGKLEGRKIVVVGGSGALFGIEAAAIEQDTGIPTVNFATHAGLDLPYLLHRGAKTLVAGDLLLLSIEYPLLNHNGQPRPLLVDFAMFFDRPYIHALPPRAWVDFYLGFDYLAANIDSVKRAAGVTGTAEAVYRVDTLNARGDQTANTVAAATPDRLQRVRGMPPIKADIDSDSVAMQRLAQTVSELRRRGVGVAIVWPGMVDRPPYHTATYRAYFDTLTRRFGAFGAVVLGRPEDSLLPLQDMFDTHFHPNARGRTKLTHQLVARLQEARLVVCEKLLAKTAESDSENQRCKIEAPSGAGADTLGFAR